MKLEIEVGVLDQIGMIESEGHPHDLLPEAAREMQAGFDVGQDPLESDQSTRRRRLIVDRCGADMRRRLPRLHVDEGRIETAELFHREILT